MTKRKSAYCSLDTLSKAPKKEKSNDANNDYARDVELIDRNKIRYENVYICDESGCCAKFLVSYKDEIDKIPVHKI